MAEFAALEGMKEVLQATSKEAGQKMALEIHAHGVELASQRLKVRRQIFIDNWHIVPPDQDGVWVIQLNGNVRWIDDGMPHHNMLDDLLSGPKAKTIKSGKKRGMKYVVVPFDHGPGKGKTNSTPAQQDLAKTIQAELRTLNKGKKEEDQIKWGKIEKGADGKPKLGLLHKLNIMHSPTKTAQGVGQGWGPIGEVKQGPNARQAAGGGPGGGGHPFLEGIRVYQSEAQDNKGKTFTKRSFMTFRIATEEHRGQGRWDHPGLKPVHIVEDTHAWALTEWATKIEPGLLDIVLSKL